MSNYSFWSPTLSHSCWRPNCQTELYHFGVKGMRWGIRHDKEPSGRSFGRRVKPQGDRDHYIPILETDTTANIAMQTARATATNPIKALLGTAVLASGAVATAKIKANEIRTSKLETDSATGLKIKDPKKTWTQEEDMKAVNPGYINLMSQGSRNNCVLCSITYDLRRRGYDVSANFATYGYTEDDIAYYYPGCVTTYCTRDGATTSDQEEYIDQTLENLIATGEGARGTLCVSWMGGGGHSMAYEIHNGQPVIYDCQIGKKVDAREILRYTTDSSVTRLDNVPINKEFIKEATHDDHSKKRR